MTSSLPPCGPAWAGSLMGVSIAAGLSAMHEVTLAPTVLLGAATVVLVALAIGWARPGRLDQPRFDASGLGAWGMALMGLLAYGSAWSTVAGAIAVQVLTWWIATPLGVYACLKQAREFPGTPSFTWGLALVTPMVAATSGAQLWQEGVYGDWMWFAAAGCFVLSLVLGLPVFARVYWSRPRLAPGMSGTFWIPLGIVGQSTAAAQLLLPPLTATTYGVGMLLVGLPLAFLAMRNFYPAVVSFAEYAPGWWGSTFPVGTLCLGSFCLAENLGSEDLALVSQALVLLLFAHLAVASVRAVTWWHKTSKSDASTSSPTSLASARTGESR